MTDWNAIRKRVKDKKYRVLQYFNVVEVLYRTDLHIAYITRFTPNNHGMNPVTVELYVSDIIYEHIPQILADDYSTLNQIQIIPISLIYDTYLSTYVVVTTLHVIVQIGLLL